MNKSDVEKNPVLKGDLFQVQACAVMHYEAITRKQRYCQNAQAIGFKKASECNVLHFACIELHPSCIVHWLLHGLGSFFSSGHSNRKIKIKYYLHLSREEIFCHLQTASDISIQCCGNVFNSRWCTKFHRPSLQSRSLKVFVLLFFYCLLYCNHATPPHFDYMEYMKRWVPKWHSHHLGGGVTQIHHINRQHKIQTKKSFF